MHEFFYSVTGHGRHQVVQRGTQNLKTIEESYAVNLDGQKLFGIGSYDLYFGFRIVEIFDDKMGIVRSRIMHEKWNEIFVVVFSVFQL